MNKQTLITSLNKKYPKMHIMADGNGWVSDSPDAFSISAEEPVTDSRGYDMFNYWTEDYEVYEFGISTEFSDFLSDHGWYAEWVNPGVVAIIKD